MAGAADDFFAGGRSLKWRPGLIGSDASQDSTALQDALNAAEESHLRIYADPRYVVAGSLMLTNLSTEQLVGLNGNVT